MKQLFVCDTPYQIFNVLNLVFNESGNADSQTIVRDLFIIDQFKSARDISVRIKNSKLFDNVFVSRLIAKSNSCPSTIIMFEKISFLQI